nr:MAG: RNA-dependent RNA polymerase [Sichuan sediment noda-like virus 9]
MSAIFQFISDEYLVEGIGRCCSHYVKPTSAIHPATLIAIEAARPSSWFETYCPSAKSLAVGSGVLGGAIFLWHHRSTIRGICGIGPYASANTGCWRSIFNRALSNATTHNLDKISYPLNSFVDFEPTRPSDNGHGVSGAVRDSARKCLSNAITANGQTQFEISPATQSTNCERRAHQHYAPSDLRQSITVDIPQPNDVILGIDIDYYLEDLGRFLGYPNVCMFFTFAPIRVSGMDGDTPYRINNNEVVYTVSGGGAWTHQVWNWFTAGEFVEFEYQSVGLWSNALQLILGLFGIRKMMLQKIHHARLWKKMPNRAVVWCVPQSTYWKVAWLPSDMHVRTMKRVNYQVAGKPGWNAIIDQTSSNIGPLISIGRENHDLQVTIEKATHDLVMGSETAQSVSARLISLQIKDPNVLALMVQYFKGKPIFVPDIERVGRSVQPLVHWPATFEADAPEVSARVYSDPVVDDCNMMPMLKRWESMSNSLETRVTSVRNDKVPPQRYVEFATEFVKLVVPEVGVGVPYDLEHTATLLDKPSQVLAVKQVWETIDVEARRLIEAFIKNEACNKPARIVSSFPDMRFLLSFSSFTLAFRDEVLHSESNSHWFCPGLTPLEIANKVVNYVRAIDCPIEGDYTNFDGTVSSWCQRNIMNAVYHRYFNQTYARKLRGYTDMLIACPARAKRFGFRYDAGVGVKSGSPTTCDLNTVLNAFIQYSAVRLTDRTLTPEEAFGSIGLCFGDDSLFERKYQKKFTLVATQLGMSLKVENYDHAAGITFLARVYPDPYNTTTTFQDPLRTWRKLHLTTRDPNIPIADAAIDRVEGYGVTDSLSPIVGTYVRFIQRIYGKTCGNLETRRKRKSCDREKPYWLTVGGAWPQAEEDVEIMYAVAAYRAGTDVEKLRDFERMLEQTDTAWFKQGVQRESEYPYTGTLAPDGLPIGDVDLRLIQDEREKQFSRCNNGAAREPKGTASTLQAEARSDSRCTDQRRRRSGGLPINARRNRQQSAEGYRQPNVKTNGAGIPSTTRRQAERPADRRPESDTERYRTNVPGTSASTNQCYGAGRGCNSRRGRNNGAGPRTNTRGR